MRVLRLFGLVWSAGVAGSLAAQEQAVALVGGMLLDGYEAPAIHHAVVVIRDGRIVDAGPQSEVTIPADARVVDTRGLTMMPGLIDLHVHTMILGHGEYTDWFNYFGERKEEMMEVSARQLLEAGVTTAVDLGVPLEILRVRDRINAGTVPGPRLLVSGPWIAGQSWSTLPRYFQRIAQTPEEAARMAQELVDAGVDVIKTWAGMDEARLRAVVEVAHRNGVRVHSHLYAPEDLWAAMRAGVDVLQHAGSGGNPPYDQALVQEIAQRGIPVVQTIAHRVWLYPQTLEFPERLQDARLRATTSPELYDLLQASFIDIRRLSYFRTTPRQIRNAEVAARQLIAASVVMGMGTDSGSPLNFHTESAWREISALVDAGMTPLQAISASTKTGAEIIGMGRDLGTIEPGKIADVLIVRGNPLFDINTLANVEYVVKGGSVIRPE